MYCIFIVSGNTSQPFELHWGQLSPAHQSGAVYHSLVNGSFQRASAGIACEPKPPVRVFCSGHWSGDGDDDNIRLPDRCRISRCPDGVPRHRVQLIHFLLVAAVPKSWGDAGKKLQPAAIRHTRGRRRRPFYREVSLKPLKPRERLLWSNAVFIIPWDRAKTYREHDVP